METTKIAKIIDSSGAHNVAVDLTHALEILTLDPEQAIQLIQRANDNLRLHVNVARRTRTVTAPDKLHHYPAANPRPILKML